MVNKLFGHRQFDGARGGAFRLPGRWTDRLALGLQIFLEKEEVFSYYIPRNGMIAFFCVWMRLMSVHRLVIAKYEQQ